MLDLASSSYYLDSMRSVFLLILIVLGCSRAFGRDEVFFVGGAGERGRKINIFDRSFSLAYKLAIKTSARATFFVDVDHPSTKEVLKLRPDVQPKLVSKEAVEKGFDDLVKRIEGDGFRSGEKLVLMVETHGSQENASDVEIETVDGRIQIESFLRRIVDAAAKKKIKIAIILGSCYSGTVVERFSRENHACIVSATAPARLGYSNFTSEVVDKLSTGTDLETAFLMTRKVYLLEDANADFFGLPQISTEAGRTTMDHMAVFSRHRFEAIDHRRALLDQISCDDELAEIDRLKMLAKTALGKTTESDIEKALERFRRTAKFYGLSKDDIEQRKRKVDYLDAEWNTWCERAVPASSRELQNWHFANQSQYCSALMIAPRCFVGPASQRPPACGERETMVPVLEDPLFVKRAQYMERLWRDVANELYHRVLNRPFASSVFTNKDERNLYDVVYRERSKVLKNTPNACRDFKF